RHMPRQLLAQTFDRDPLRNQALLSQPLVCLLGQRQKVVVGAIAPFEILGRGLGPRCKAVVLLWQLPWLARRILLSFLRCSPRLRLLALGHAWISNPRLDRSWLTHSLRLCLLGRFWFATASLRPSHCILLTRSHCASR